jgi:hypothetical protein
MLSNKPIMLTVVTLSVVLLNVMAPSLLKKRTTVISVKSFIVETLGVKSPMMKKMFHYFCKTMIGWLSMIQSVKKRLGSRIIPTIF